MFKKAFLFFFLVTLSGSTFAGQQVNLADTVFCFPNESCSSNISTKELKNDRPNPVLQLFKIRQKKNKKITAAILAFPFPFGIVGLHRIYLGTAPHVPVVYIGTLGGVFGILPFIDFCVLVLDKDIDRYIESKKVLMWVDDNKTRAK